MNPDLPQFEHGLEGWSEITLGFDLAPYIEAIPVAVQVWGTSFRSLTTGIVVSTDDQFDGASTDNERPIRTIIYFRDAEELNIVWANTRAVLAMVAVVTGEEEHDSNGDPA